MDIHRLQHELYGRLFVQMVKRGIIPEAMIEAMYDEFAHLGELATRDEDRAHFEGLAQLTALLLTRADVDPAGDAAGIARSRFRVVEGGDGGNSPT